jgi:CRISPR/Cas system-associated endoribonuclease Cas2
MMLPSRVVVRTVIFLATVYCVWYLNWLQNSGWMCNRYRMVQRVTLFCLRL